MWIANLCASICCSTRTCSWYLDHNIQAFTSDPKGVKKIEFAPVDNEGNFSGLGSGFTGTRKQHHDPQFLGLTNNRSRIV